MTKTIRVVLADDHPLMRAGVATILASERDMVVVGEADNGDATHRLCQELQPDVLLLDLNMPGPSPSATVTNVHMCCPAVKIVVLSAYDDDAYIRRIVAVGVVGYVLKDEAPQSVAQAIRSVAQGGTWFSRPIIEKLVRWGTQEASPSELMLLTERERTLLHLLARGWDNPRIASELALTEQTVRNYTSRLYRKLNLRSRAEAIVWARDNDVVAE